MIQLILFNLYTKYRLSILYSCVDVLRKKCYAISEGRTDGQTDGRRTDVNHFAPAHFFNAGYKRKITRKKKTGKINSQSHDTTSHCQFINHILTPYFFGKSFTKNNSTECIALRGKREPIQEINQLEQRRFSIQRYILLLF